MKTLHWNEEKNKKLQQERGISFEDCQLAIEEGRLLDVVDHPNQKKYPDQKIMILEIDDYAYAVPFVEESEDCYFLKTVFPNRDATKEYLLNK